MGRWSVDKQAVHYSSRRYYFGLNGGQQGPTAKRSNCGQRCARSKLAEAGHDPIQWMVSLGIVKLRSQLAK